MAAPCTEHLFFTGRKGVGKSTLVRTAIDGKRVGGFFTKRVEGLLERPSVHLLRAGALADTAGYEMLVMDELGPHEEQAAAFRQAVLRALDGDAPIIGVLQQAESAFLRQVAAHPNVRVITVTEENRDALHHWLIQGE